MAPNHIQLALSVAYNSQNMRQPPTVMAVPDDLHQIIGRIITQWALLEQEVDLLIMALLQANNISEPGWEKRQFIKRWRLLQQEWKTFIGENKELSIEMDEIGKEMRACKLIRDWIAHKRMFAGIYNDRPFMRFQNENTAFPWTKKYYNEDFIQASLHVSSAVGRIFRLTKLEYSPFFSSQSISLLRRLPNVDHLRFPMPKVR